MTETKTQPQEETGIGEKGNAIEREKEIVQGIRMKGQGTEIHQNETAERNELKNCQEVEIEKEGSVEAAIEIGKEIKGQVERDPDPKKEGEADPENEGAASQKIVEVGQEIDLRNVLRENGRKNALVEIEMLTRKNRDQVHHPVGLEIKGNPTKRILILCKILVHNVGLAREVKLKMLVISTVQLTILKLKKNLTDMILKNIKIKMLVQALELRRVMKLKTKMDYRHKSRIQLTFVASNLTNLKPCTKKQALNVSYCNIY